jgi:hypothetical protein
MTSKKLLLAYPGTGARELASLIHAFHLDSIGYFQNPKDYWTWNIDLQRFGYLWEYSKIIKFVGYGLNWRGLVDIVGTINVTLYTIPLNDYTSNIIEFRKSVQYAKIDLPMILQTKNSDLSLYEYGQHYMDFVITAKAYISKRFSEGF